MNKLLTLICALLTAAGIAQAQTPARSVEADDIKFTRTEGQVEVSFTLRAGKKATAPSYNLVVNPILRGGATQRQLPSIVVQGKRSKVSDMRHELATGERRYEQPPVYMAPGGSLDYTAMLPYEEWMCGGDLVLEGVSVGCCSATEVELGLIARDILYAEPVVETKIVATEVVVPGRTTGETLARQYPFVAPVDGPAGQEPRSGGIDYDMPLNMVDGQSARQQSNLAQDVQDVQNVFTSTHKGSISVYFSQGRHTIDRDFASNNKNLVELISAVRALDASEDTRIVKIIIAGFASPEGSRAFNERLAWKRAVTLRDMLTANSDIDPGIVELYNGGVDWLGLRELIEKSDYGLKHRMLEIIDTVPVWNPQRNVGRLGELMRLDGGSPYRQISRDLFPQLRQAAYIKVYYENK